MNKLSFKEYVKEHTYSERLDEQSKEIQIYYIEKEELYIIEISLGVGLVYIEYYPEWNGKANEIKDRIVKESYPTHNGIDQFQLTFVTTSNQDHVMDVIEMATQLGDEGISLHTEDGFIQLVSTKEYTNYRMHHIHVDPGKCRYQFLRKKKRIPVNWAMYAYSLPIHDKIASVIHSYLALVYDAVESFYREESQFRVLKYQTEEYFYRKLTLEETVRNAGIDSVEQITIMIMDYFDSVTIPAPFINQSYKRRKPDIHE